MKLLLKVVVGFGLLTMSVVHAADSVVSVNAKGLVTGVGVRVRAAPSATAQEVGKLAFGSTLTLQKRTGEKAQIGVKSAYWYHINAPMNGWVFGSFVQDFNAAQPQAAWLSLIRAKLGKADVVIQEATLPFADAVEISQFASKAAAQTTDTDSKGELELAQWRATQQALYAIPIAKGKEAPYAAWLKTLGDKAFEDEISARYLLRTYLLWQLADQYQKAAIGDVIAWQAANVYPGGECEGFIVCVSGRSQMMEGEYLKRFPQGQYVQAALQDVNETLDFLVKEWPEQRADGKDVDLVLWEKILKPLAASPAADKARRYLRRLQTLRG